MYNFFIFFLQTFNLNDRGKNSLLASVSKINKFNSESLAPMASVEIGTKKWNAVFETPAGSEATHVKKSKTNEPQVSVLCNIQPFTLASQSFRQCWIEPIPE